MSDLKLPDRNDNWRVPARDAIREISPEVADGLFVTSSRGGTILAGMQALKELKDKDRKKIWKLAFPALVDQVELAWHHLDPSVIAHRDGGSSGYGEHFRFKVDPKDADLHFITWLRKLLILVGPYPQLGLMELMEHPGRLFSGSFDSPSGHCFDSDALGYLACAVLEAEPESELAIRLADSIEDQLLGRRPGRDDRCLFTAIFCAKRPELWARINRHLPEAGKEPAFLGRLVGRRTGAQPEAVVAYLKIVAGHDLLRFESVRESVMSHFGIEWRWKSHKRDDLQPWFDRWLAQIDAATTKPLPTDPGDCLLALWTEALFDGDSALARIADPTTLEVDQRLAAVTFLGRCRGDIRQPLVVRYATDPDLRVANAASGLLFDYQSKLADKDERPVLFERFLKFFEDLPDSPKLDPYPSPLPSLALDLSGVSMSLATLFSDGQEAQIEALLPKLDADARRVVVNRLNRYSLTEHEREIEQIWHGGDPDEWQRWLDDHEGSASSAQRSLLLKMLADRSPDVVEQVAKAIKGFILKQDEFALVRPVLKGKSAKKRLIVTQLLAAHPEPMLRSMVPELLASKSTGERVAALEVLRQLSEKEETAALAQEVLKSENYEPRSKEEQRAFEVLAKSIAPAAEDEPPGLHNAFGLVDPRSLEKPVPPRDHEVILHSPATLRLIEGLDLWLEQHADVMIPSTRPWMTDEPQRLGDGELPAARLQGDREEQIERFPLAVELGEWWDSRPGAMRDDDGFEAIRLKHAIGIFVGSQSPQQFTLRKVGFGCEKAPTLKTSKVALDRLFGWLQLMRPGILQPEGWIDYLIDSAETAMVRLPDGQKNWAHLWGQRLTPLINGPEPADDQHLERIWHLVRNAKPEGPKLFQLYLWYVVAFFQRGIANEAELTWHLVGDRPFGDYDRERAFNDLQMATSPPGSYGKGTDFPECQRVLRRIVDRIIELELGRGEQPEPWSYAALKIATVRGAKYLQRLLVALGKKPMRRPATGGRGPNVTRDAVLMSLIRACRPAEDDTPESFAALMKDAGIPDSRLFEIAMLRPTWTPFVAEATGIAGLGDAVGWIYAHTRSSDYQWESNARELWTGELGFDSPLSSEELLDGAVDADWFTRAHEAVGPKVWETLDAAAKFASTSNGHSRARLFADALLGKIDVAELSKRLTKKGDLDAARAIGLPPLPKANKARQDELLKRYSMLQDLRKSSRKSKAQRRASETLAVEVGTRNLARRAGFSDTVRFEWAMECEAVADLSPETLKAALDDLTCEIRIEPDGTLGLHAERDGKPLARVPAAAKKAPAFKQLKERMDELKGQASRLRPALEELMVRAVKLPVSEWKKILGHPLAGPLVQRLLFASDDGPLGIPSVDGLMGADGGLIKWPESSVELHLAHPTELLPASSWHEWQRLLFDQQIVQPFKQVFREAYFPTATETEGERAQSSRFRGQQVKPQQMMAILGGRGWIIHPEDGLYRIFRADGICAWLDFAEAYRAFHDDSELTVYGLRFTTADKKHTPIAPADLPVRVFSEALRDLDLIVSVAHATEAAPEPGQSTIDMRRDLIRETCRLLEIENVTLDDRHARIAGSLGTYRVHLASGVVHREPGGMLALQTDPQNERGRLFLPFADDDPVGITVLSRVLLFARDESIRDPKLAAKLREF